MVHPSEEGCSLPSSIFAINGLARKPRLLPRTLPRSHVGYSAAFILSI